ncbi:hypothetical protein X975_11556, partial [Stegodyphus mimosarum]
MSCSYAEILKCESQQNDNSKRIENLAEDVTEQLQNAAIKFK